jgi:4-carboxymuconolactone decarboxylase
MCGIISPECENCFLFHRRFREVDFYDRLIAAVSVRDPGLTFHRRMSYGFLKSSEAEQARNRRRVPIVDDEFKKRTQETANRLFGKGVKMDPPYRMWKEFDKDLANDFSMFITGNLYSRTVLTLPERQMAACAMLAALRATDELKLHVNAALNVGCDPRKLAEIFFQLAPYGGMPAVNEALHVYRDVLKERGEWPIK